MPVEKPLNKLIPKIYKYNFESYGLFFFVKGQQQIFPTMSIDQAIMNYFRFSKIDIDDWDLRSASTTYHRMQHDFYDCMKDESKAAETVK